MSLLFFQIIVKQCFEVFFFFFFFGNSYPALYLNLPALIQKKVLLDIKKKEKRTHLYWVYLGEVDIY